MSSLLNVSESAFLAFHGMVILAKAAPEKVRIKSIAVELKASEAHLAKVFQRLQKTGLVKSTRGPAGGYNLVGSLEEINFLDIFEAVESKVNTKICPFGKLDCMYNTGCFDANINDISNVVYDSFVKMKLSNYVQKK